MFKDIIDDESRKDTGLSELRDPLTDDAWHLLTHFREDADIQAREPRYLAAQRRGLQKWVKRLRAAR
jgi:hypothetical protein